MNFERRGVSTTAVVAAIIVAAVIVAGAFIAVTTTPAPAKTSTVTSTSVSTAVSTSVSTSVITSSVTTTSVVTTTPATTPAKHYKMALVLGGDETDDGWNAVAIQTAQVIALKYGWNVSISRDVSYSTQGNTIASYAQSGYDIVWTHGGQFIGTTEKIAAQFPKTLFVLSPTYIGDNLTSNIVGLGPSFQVTGYFQAGALAGKMTKTGSVAVVIGQWYDYLSMEFYAFQAGVHYANPSAKVYARVAGTWADPSLGYTIASTLIQQKHVDIIAQIADATGRGVIQAAQQYNTTIIGTVADQANLAVSNTLTSVMMNTTGFMETIVQHINGGTWSQIGGQVLSMNLGYLAPSHPYGPVIPADVQAYVQTVIQGIASGQITVPQKVTSSPPPDPT